VLLPLPQGWLPDHRSSATAFLLISPLPYLPFLQLNLRAFFQRQDKRRAPRHSTPLRGAFTFNCWQPRGREMPLSEIMLWATPEGPPRALQTSECRELLNPTRTSCLILAQRQPGKLLPLGHRGSHRFPPHSTTSLPPMEILES